jgi:hypothetical protein
MIDLDRLRYLAKEPEREPMPRTPQFPSMAGEVQRQRGEIDALRRGLQEAIAEIEGPASPPPTRGWVYRRAGQRPKQFEGASIEMVYLANGVVEGFPAYLWSPDPDRYIPRLNDALRKLNVVLAEMWGYE